MQIPVTSQIYLALSTPDHASLLFAAIDANRGHLSTFLPWVPYMQSVNHTQAYLQNCQKLYREGTEHSFNIFQDSVIIGRVGLSYINLPNKIANIGYWLVAAAQGWGIITQAVNVVIRYGFETAKLNRLEIKAAVNNTRSRAIPERLGFVYEGILRQAEWVNNQFLDLALYSLLRKEWKP